MMLDRFNALLGEIITTTCNMFLDTLHATIALMMRYKYIVIALVLVMIIAECFIQAMIGGVR